MSHETMYNTRSRIERVADRCGEARYSREPRTDMFDAVTRYRRISDAVTIKALKP